MEKEYTITIIPTNNPNIMKFETNHFVSPHKNYEFKNIDEAKESPLAQQLFHLPFIKTVYVASNFIGIEKYDIVGWEDIKDSLAQQLVEYLNAGQAVVAQDPNEVPQAITVYAENTPNPAVMKYVANKLIVPALFEFKNIDEAKDAPLAKKLFMLPFVKEVFMDQNYVSITKYDVAEWEEISSELRELIRTFMMSGAEAVGAASVQKEKAKAPSTLLHGSDLDDTSKQIIDILEEHVKPAVASDGGNIMFESYDAQTKKVHVVLQGACSGCPSSTFTLKNGIENMLKNMMGDKIQEVVAING
ncbi:MAG: NifU family protein [Flavobacteriaceae bacterium]|jgi:Fe-S cluster biogenesis protein NfuA|nr:NifU family protein [Flavobacteriaceae bacterium]MCI5089141.1 NifU family protein [Flavobacteriaceae bacterium]CAI8191286.1 MAG: Fe/S biogenesis protein NfuA [SAR116 cluster bacterium]